jgi:hypothetical protein
LHLQLGLQQQGLVAQGCCSPKTPVPDLLLQATPPRRKAKQKKQRRRRRRRRRRREPSAVPRGTIGCFSPFPGAAS